MITIVLDNSHSQIKGLLTEQFRALKAILSYQTDPQAAYFAGYVPRKRYLIDAKGFFPTGLLYLVESFLKNNNISFEFTEIRKLPKKVKFGHLSLGGRTPYPDQVDAADSVVKNHRCGIIMPTGAGKSLVIALIASRLQVKTLVVVPALELKKQLKNTLSELLNGSPHITVENIDSRALDSPGDYGCLIIDECHHAAAKTYQVLNKTAWKNIYYRVFLTATYFRNEESEQLLFEGIAGRPSFELTYKEAVSKGYIMPVDAFYVDVPKQPCDLYGWKSVYNQLVVTNETRNDIIAHLMSKFVPTPTLCLVKELEHGRILSEMTGAPFVNGQDEESRVNIKLFNEGKVNQLIGTTGVLGEGIDTVRAEFVIIAGLGKAKSQFMQSCGRGVRKYQNKTSCKVVLFHDKSHKFTSRHFKEQCRILKEEYGVIPFKLEL